ARPLPLTSETLSSPTANTRNVNLPLRGRKAALVMVALQAPAVVMQVEPIWPPSATKLTEVPSGTGLLKWSNRRAVNIVVIPSRFQPSILRIVALTEKQPRSEEHTSELQSRGHLVCRLLLEKKKKMQL